MEPAISAALTSNTRLDSLLVGLQLLYTCAQDAQSQTYIPQQHYLE